MLSHKLLSTGNSALPPSPPELVWSQPRCIGDVPSKRSGHSLTIVKSGVAYLFGGDSDMYSSCVCVGL